jgi:hypothetical protein
LGFGSPAIAISKNGSQNACAGSGPVGSVDREREQPEEQPIVLEHDRHRRRHHIGGVAGDRDVGLVDIDQLGVERRDRRRAALVVVKNQLDRSAEQAALGIDVGLPDLHRQQCRLADRGEPAGQRHAEADCDRLGCPRHARHGEAGQNRHCGGP